jgi:acylphosphatase
VKLNSLYLKSKSFITAFFSFPMPTIHLLIKGKVQGVFYRASAKEVAKEIDLTGWISNSGNGDVEAIVSGTQTQLDIFITWCQNGPKRAEVSEVVISKVEEQIFKNFSIKR